MISATRLTQLLASVAAAQRPGTLLSWRRPLLPYRSLSARSNVDLTMSNIEVLAGTHDRYDGVQIDPDGLPTDPSEFTSRLTESLLVRHKPRSTSQSKFYAFTALVTYPTRGAGDVSDVQEWQRTARRGIWLRLPASKAGLLLEPALQQGFTFHHAEKSYIQLTRWLPSTEDKLPANASHQARRHCQQCLVPIYPQPHSSWQPPSCACP